MVRAGRMQKTKTTSHLWGHLSCNSSGREKKTKRNETNSVSQTMCCIGYCCIKTAVAQAVKPLKKMATHSQNNNTATHNTTLAENERQRRFIYQLNKITMMY